MTGTLAFFGLLLLSECAHTFSRSCSERQLTLVKGTQCSAFEACRSGARVLDYCPPGFLFDVGAQSCRRQSESVCNDDSTGCEEGLLYGSLKSKHLYYKCNNNRIVHKFCPIGTSFNLKLQSCQGVSFSENGNQERESSDSCSKGQTKPLRCRDFMKCQAGKWVVQSCALGEKFDQELQQCRLGVCHYRSKRGANACTEGHRRRVEGTCKEYTECVNGEEIKRSCSPCMNFDDSKSSCQYVIFSSCPNPPPPVPTEPTTPVPTTLPTKPTTPKPTTPKPTTPSPEPEPTTPSPSTVTKPTPTIPSPEPEPTTPSPSTVTQSTTPKPTTPKPTTPSPEPEPTSPSPSTVTKPTAPSPEPEPTTLSPKSTKVEPYPIPTRLSRNSPAPSSKSSSQNTPASTAPSENSFPPTTTPVCRKGDRKAIPGECKEYEQCYDGKYFKDRCNYFQHFDIKTMDCKVFGYTCP